MQIVLKIRMIRGKFIVLEGIDGSGKTTQAGLIADFLRSRGKTVLLTKEPSMETEASARIKEVIEDKTKTLLPQELQALFIQDRKEHVQNVIEPALAKRDWVICDRYIFSTIAYGGVEGVSPAWLRRQNKQFIYPDLIFILHADPAICLQRILRQGKSPTIFEETGKLQKIMMIYAKISKEFPNIREIHAEQPVPKVLEEITRALGETFPEDIKITHNP